MRINGGVAGGSSNLRQGQLLYLPQGACESDEADILDTLSVINYIVLNQMTAEDRRILAEGYALLDNIASHPDQLKLHDRSGTMKLIVNYGNSLAGGVISGVALQTRFMGEILRDLEAKYAQAHRTHGKLTPAFYAERQRIYRALDSEIGRLARTITTRTPYSMKAKDALRISTKSQMLTWSRQGNDGNVRGFKQHFQNISTTSRVLRTGGYVVIGIDAMLTLDTIQKACATGETYTCQRTRAVEGADWAGRTAGGMLGGGVAAYGVCSTLFALPSAGSSLLWCGLIAGAAGGVAGGVVGGSVFTGAAEVVYDKVDRLRHEP